MDFFTIGVYNSSEEDFFGKLISEQIDTFCDIRQRRGVRGAKYSFVNSIKLQERLHELKINYIYIPDLAPTSKIRELQKETDLLNNELKSQRKVLGEVFKEEYNKKIIEHFDFYRLLSQLKLVNSRKVALFCVEEIPQACHRSIVAVKLMNEYGIDKINDL